MPNNTNKPLFKDSEIALLVLLTPVAYVGAVLIIFFIISPPSGPDDPDGFMYEIVTTRGPDPFMFIISFFDVVGIILARIMWPRKSKRVIVILTVLLLTLSASLMTCVVVINAMRWH